MKDFKVRCVESNTPDTVKGKVYEVKDGILTLERGQEYKNYWSSHGEYRNVNQINQYMSSKFELVPEPQQFTKADLKTGMRVETRAGAIFIVIKDSMFSGFIVNRIGWDKLEIYNDDLTTIDKSYSKSDIVKIYDCPCEFYFLDKDKLGLLLWQRPEAKHYTISEAEAKLSEIDGQAVKIGE